MFDIDKLKSMLSIDLYNNAISLSKGSKKAYIIDLLWERKEYRLIKSLAKN